MSLSDYTILDFSKLLPGPFCTKLLAEMGMRVIRVELPHWPDRMRTVSPDIDGHGFAFWMVNRGKESICLNYRKPAGKKALLKMIEKVDVVVEGFRPGTMAKMGLDAKTLLKLNPKLVYLSLSGYGQTGPKARKAAHDVNFLAESGFLGARDSNNLVSFPSTQVGDLAGATTAAARVLGALLDGGGVHLDVAMDRVMRDWMVLPCGWELAAGTPYKPGTEWFSGSGPFYRLYKTKGGRYLAVGALEPQFHLNLLSELGRDDLVGKPRKTVERALERLFASKTLAYWSKKLADKDVCVSPVKTLAEAFKDWKPNGRAPRIGQHNKSAMKSLGLSAAEIASATNSA
ncbi:MAG: CoA transferase [Elusimicrobia bacterium]|nr:MAG: CoA transferase [Elusimicrobiota bacterium]